MPGKNVGFVSTRICGTDGVSLEIKKWSEVLERMGYTCFYMAGLLDTPPEKSFLVEEAFFEYPEIIEIQKACFGRRKRPVKITEKIYLLKEKLKSSLYQFCKKYNIELLIPENALSIPMNIPLGLAITEFIAETGILTIAHHHDFSWERDRFLINCVNDFLNMAFPPDLPSIRHVVINSLASQQLSHRRGISNFIIPNVLDFSNPPTPPDEFSHDIREKIGLKKDDLFILQPTRIVPRKWIERAIELVYYLELSSPILVISHSSGDEGREYVNKIKEYAKRLGVKLMIINNIIGKERKVLPDGKKIYTISDAYKEADLITYPSGYEGFGNAFLEAIYFKKPIVVNRYSIYVVDIEPKGFEAIVIDGFVSEKTVKKVHYFLNNPSKLKEITEKNYLLAKKYFSFEILEKKLKLIIDSFS
jgi:glycosyltransferase involved in cell wall biosynthesis